MTEPHPKLRALIESAYESRAEITPKSVSADVKSGVEESLELLDSGRLRVAQREADGWYVNEWLKKAVLLSFRIKDNAPIAAGAFNFYDKVPLKYTGWDAGRFSAAGVRVVPPATVRYGAYVAACRVM
jgi:2,3,4,5-tetrahydropyridine-2-carboxylate N-succinyltransferase